jgi:DNA-binding MarR family transcriptional regulator
MQNRDRLDYLSDNWHRARPDIDIRPWQIWGRATRLHELFLAEIGPALRRHGLSFKEFQTLAALVLSGRPYEANPTELQKLNLLTSGGMTILLTRMERAGLVRRRPDRKDRRGVRIRLTEDGLRRFEQAVLEENRIEHDLLKSLSEEERLVLGTLLRKLLIGVDPVKVPVGAVRTKTPRHRRSAADRRRRSGPGESSSGASD